MDDEKNRPGKIEIRELEPLIPLHKSHRLASLGNKAGPEGRSSITFSDAIPNNKHDEQLIYAQNMIDSKIKTLMDSLPAGRKNKLFTVRYGSIESIKLLPIVQAFKLLQIDASHINLKHLAGKNYYGNRVK